MKCFCATTRRLARMLTQQYEEALRPVCLTPAQFELMSTVVQQSGISQARLAESLCLDQTTLSRSLNLLITRGWIVRDAGRNDRRQTVYAATEEGRKGWSEALPLWQSIHEQMQARLGQDLGAVWSVLEVLFEAARRAEVKASPI